MSRLVLVIPAFPQLSETFMVSKFLGLLGRGWDVHIVCQRSNPAEWQHFPQLQARPSLRHRIHVTYPHHSIAPVIRHYPAALLRASDKPAYWQRGQSRFGPGIFKKVYFDAPLIALRPHLIHFGFGSLAKGRMYLKELLDSKISLSFRGYDLNYVGLETADYYHDIWEESDGIHLLGQNLWQRAQRRGCPTDKLHVLIPPAIDTGFFLPPSKEVVAAERPLRILSIGRLTWVKGYEYALQAIKLLVEQGIAVEYRLVGDGPYRGPLAFLRHELGLEDCVHFSGSQPPGELLGHLAWADIFLHTAVSEGFGNAVLEAQAMELPVVCSDAGGLPENVSDGQTGYVVPRRNPRALAAKLACLAHNPDLRQRLGRAGRLRVQQHFQLQDQIAAFDQFFRRVLEA